jgi:hypothetical protein
MIETVKDGKLLAKSSTVETVNIVRNYYKSEAMIRRNVRFELDENSNI